MEEVQKAEDRVIKEAIPQVGREVWLKFVEKEYDIALQRKINLENRAGIIIAFLGTVGIITLEKVPPVLIDLYKCLPLSTIIGFILALAYYISFLITIVSAFQVINVRELEVISLECLKDEHFKAAKDGTEDKVISIYVRYVRSLKNINIEKCKFFKRSLVVLLINVTTIIFLNFINI